MSYCEVSYCDKGVPAGHRIPIQVYLITTETILYVSLNAPDTTHT